MSNRHLRGYRPDSRDHRDLPFSIPGNVLFAATPQMVDLREQCMTLRYDQGEVGDCTSCSVIEAVRFNLLPTGKDFAASHRALYWYTRYLETKEEKTNPKTDLTQVDCGATLRDTIKAVVKFGLIPDSEWDDSHDFREKPSDTAEKDARTGLISAYKRIPVNLLHIKSVFIMDKPFPFGMAVFPSMMSKAVAKTGIVPMPGANEAPIGGHAPLACGFDAQYVYFLNSWGDWGDQGFGYLRWEYMLNPGLVGDMWLIEGAKAA